MDQDETWHAGRPRPWPHGFRWKRSSPSSKGGGAPNFGPYLLWPNGWMDQDATWHVGRSRPKPHCARWGPSSPPPKGGGSQFSAHVYCGQTAGWMKIPLRTEVYLSPGHIVLDGDPAPPPRKRDTAAPFFSAHVYCRHGRPSQLLLSSCKLTYPTCIWRLHLSFAEIFGIRKLESLVYRAVSFAWSYV